jgi:hypothetical protein
VGRRPEVLVLDAQNVVREPVADDDGVHISFLRDDAGVHQRRPMERPLGRRRPLATRRLVELA